MGRAAKPDIAGTSSVLGSRPIQGVCSTVAGQLWFVVRGVRGTGKEEVLKQAV